MQYQFVANNIEISDSMKALAESKFSKFDTKFGSLPEGSLSARIVMDKAPQDQFAVKVELNVNGKVFFTDHTHFNLESALIKCVEELNVQIDKTKLWDQKWEDQREAKRFTSEDGDAAVEE